MLNNFLKKENKIPRFNFDDLFVKFMHVRYNYIYYNIAVIFQ